MNFSITQLMGTDSCCSVRWKRHRPEMFRTRYLVHPMVCWRHQGVLAGLQIQS